MIQTAEVKIEGEKIVDQLIIKELSGSFVFIDNGTPHNISFKAYIRYQLKKGIAGIEYFTNAAYLQEEEGVPERFHTKIECSTINDIKKREGLTNEDLLLEYINDMVEAYINRPK